MFCYGSVAQYGTPTNLVIGKLFLTRDLENVEHFFRTVFLTNDTNKNNSPELI